MTVIFIAETKHSAVATKNSPILASKNDDGTDLHRFEEVLPGVHPGSSNGDVSPGVLVLLGGDKEVYRAVGV